MLPNFTHTVDPKEPASVLPKDLDGKRVVLKYMGGIGDVLMGIGGVAYQLRNAKLEITAAVQDHQAPLIKHMIGVDDTIKIPRLNDPAERANFDVILNFAGSLNLRRQLKKDDYYKLLSETAGIEIGPGKFDFDYVPRDKWVAFHPSASNPNRRWTDEKWRELAYQFRDRGYRVHWYGTRDEFGFNDDGIFKISDFDESLKQQAFTLAGCEFFVGCDSGFAHVAGILGIPGRVLFFTTHPDDVIARYPSLKGVHNFESYDDPSRSLRCEEHSSDKYRRALTVEQVLASTDISAIDCTPKPRREVASMKIRMAIIGRGYEADRVATYLAKSYDIELLEELPLNGKEFEVFIDIDERQCKIRIEGGVEVRVSNNHPENVRRAVRELLGRERGEDDGTNA